MNILSAVPGLPDYIRKAENTLYTFVTTEIIKVSIISLGGLS
jgi:hypothetical protein